MRADGRAPTFATAEVEQAIRPPATRRGFTSKIRDILYVGARCLRLRFYIFDARVLYVFLVCNLHICFQTLPASNRVVVGGRDRDRARFNAFLAADVVAVAANAATSRRSTAAAAVAVARAARA